MRSCARRAVLAASCLALAIVSLVGTAATASAALPYSNTPVDWAWQPAGSVATVEPSPTGTTVYIGGNFSYLGPDTGSAVRFDAAGVEVDETRWPVFEGGYVYAIEPDGMGGWYVGGSFTAVDGMPYRGLVHVFAWGSLDLQWSSNVGTIAAGGVVHDIAVSTSTGRVYAGGDFSSIDGDSVGATNLAVFDAGSGFIDRGFSTNGFNAAVRAVELHGDHLYVGGDFTQYELQGRTRLLRVVADGSGVGVDGTLDAWAPVVAGGAVYDMDVEGSGLYVVGDFTSPRLRGMRFDLGPGAPAIHAWNPQADFLVRAVDASPTNVAIVGRFDSVSGGTNNRRHVAVYSTSSHALVAGDPGSAVRWSGDPMKFATDVVVSGSTVRVGGNFDEVAGVLASGAFEATIGTSSTTPWLPKAGGAVYAMADAPGSGTIIGGVFRSAGGVMRESLAEIDLDTGQPTSWAPRVLNPLDSGEAIHAIKATDNAIYVGGEGFSTASPLRALDPHSEEVLPAPTVSDPVRAIVRVIEADGAGRIYVGGSFAGPTRNLFRFPSGDGAADVVWDPAITGAAVHALAFPAAGTQVLVAGEFSQLGGQPCDNAGSLTTSTGAASGGWDPSMTLDSVVRTVSVASDGSVWLGGDFSGFLRHTDSAGAPAPPPPAPTPPVPGARVRATHVGSDAMYFVGEFLAMTPGGGKHKIAAMQPTGTATDSWTPTPPGYGIWSSANDVVQVGTRIVVVGANGVGIYEAPHADTTQPYVDVTGIDEALPGVDPADGTFVPAGGRTVFVRTIGGPAHPSFMVRARAYDRWRTTGPTYSTVSGLAKVSWPSFGPAAGNWTNGTTTAGAPRGLSLGCVDNANLGPGLWRYGLDRAIDYDSVTPGADRRPDQLPQLPARLLSQVQPMTGLDIGEGPHHELVSCRWKGFVVAPDDAATAQVSFRGLVDNVMRLRIDGALAIDYTNVGISPASTNLAFDPNEAHAVEYEWGESGGDAEAVLQWQGMPGWSWSTVPEAAYVTRADYAKTYTFMSAGGTMANGPVTQSVVAADRAGLMTSPALGEFTVTIDNELPAMPAFGVAAPDSWGWSRSGAFTIDLPTVSDGYSGIATVVVERRSYGGLDDGDCTGTYTDWAPVTGGPFLADGSVDIVESGLATGCYQYRVRATDNVGHAITRVPAGQHDTDWTGWMRVDTTEPTGGEMTYAAATMKSSGTVTVDWSAPADLDSGLGDGTLYREQSPLSADTCSGPWTNLTVRGVVNQAPTFTDSGLTAATCYRYRYDVRNRAGEPTPYSWGLEIKVDDTLPTASVAVTNGPTVTTGVDIAVSASDAHSQVASYVVNWSGPSGAGQACDDSTIPLATTCTWGLGVPPVDDGTYTLTLVTTDAAGNASNPATATVNVDNDGPDVSGGITFAALPDQYVQPGAIPTIHVKGGAGATGSIRAQLVASDTPSGIGTVTFPTLGTGWTPSGGAGTPTGSLYERTYAWSGSPAAGTHTVTATDTFGNSSSQQFTVAVDSTPPTGGSISYLATGSPTVSFGSGTDSGSQHATTEILRRERTADANGTCTGTWPASYSPLPTPVVFTGEQPDNTQWSDPSVQRGRCYQWALRVMDRVGNAANVASPVTYVTPAVGISVAAAGPTTLVEGQSFVASVALTAAPASDVEVSYVGDGQLGSTTSQVLRFTTLDWNLPQDVTISAVDDRLDETDGVPARVRFAVSSSADVEYAAAPAIDVARQVNDNDAAALALSVPGGVVAVGEPAASSTYTVALATEPYGAVTVQLGAGTQATAHPTGDPSDTSLTFTPTNWNVPQSVTVAAVDDPDVDGTRSTTITHTISATAARDVATYGAITAAANAVDVQVADDDKPGFQVDGPVNPELSEADASQVATVRARLTARPSSDVTLTFSAPGGQVTASGAVVLSPTNWDTWQTMTIRATDDSVAEPPLHQVVGQIVASSLDPAFAALAPVTGPVTIRDDDPAAFVTSPGTGWTLDDDGRLELDETATSGAILRIRAVGDPTADVTITPVVQPADQLVVLPASQKIAAGSHEQVVSFSVRAINDREAELDPHPATVAWKVTTGDALYAGAAIPITVARIKDAPPVTPREATPDPGPTGDGAGGGSGSPGSTSSTDGGQGGTGDPSPQPDPDPNATTTADDGQGDPGTTVGSDGAGGDDQASGTGAGSKATRDARAKDAQKNPARRLKDWASENKGTASVAASAAGTAAIWGAKPLALAGKALMGGGGGGLPGHPPGLTQLRHLFKRKVRKRVTKFWRGKRRDLDVAPDEDDWDDFLWGDRAA